MARFHILLSLGAALALPAGAMAQSSLPSTVDPGKMDERFRERPQPSLPAEAVQVPAERPSDEAARAVSFRLDGILVTGAETFPGDIEALYDDLVGRRVTLLDLYTLADRITERYRQAGNSRAEARLPAQTITEGLALVRVEE